MKRREYYKVFQYYQNGVTLLFGTRDYQSAENFCKNNIKPGELMIHKVWILEGEKNDD